MQRLEITGETPEALYFNVVKTLSIFLRGAPASAAAAPAEEITPAASEVKDLAANSTPEEINPVMRGAPLADHELDVKPKRKASPGKMTQKAAQAGLNDDISDVGGAAKTIEHEPKVLTLDGDIRPRLQAIQKAHTERGHDMPAVVAYIQRLYGPFGIAKIPQLKPEQFEEFMEASEAYLSGEA